MQRAPRFIGSEGLFAAYRGGLAVAVAIAVRRAAVVAVLGFLTGALPGQLHVTLVLRTLVAHFLFVAGTFAGRHPVLVAVMVKRGGG
ncbi:hypothetical protein GCM10027422_41980 [Hymenobacter arcticus]